jgi:hypothetical protein
MPELSVLNVDMHMATDTFIIKSLYVQNTIMLFSLGVVVLLLLHSLIKKKLKHTLAFSVWVVIIIWFFNSSFFGFSAVSVSPEGVYVNYGILSTRNAVLTLDSNWKIETYFGGIRRMKKLYFLRIADRESMKVRTGKGIMLLQEIGNAIERAKRKL